MYKWSFILWVVEIETRKLGLLTEGPGMPEGSVGLGMEFHWASHSRLQHINIYSKTFLAKG